MPPRILALALLACARCDLAGEPPSFTHELFFWTESDASFTVRAGGETVSPDASTGAYRILHEYESYERALEAEPVAVQVEHGGAITLDSAFPLDQCSEYRGACGPLARAVYSNRINADGTACELCASLSCYDRGGMCGGWIAGPALQKR